VSVWTAWTWISIAVLTVGSLAVFAWFLLDLVRIRREILEEERVDPIRRGGGDDVMLD